MFEGKGHTSVFQDELSQKTMLLVVLFIIKISLVLIVKYFCQSAWIHAVFECSKSGTHQVWKLLWIHIDSRAILMTGRRWTGGGVIQTHQTKHDTLDVYFVAQHNNKACSMKWKDWQIWEMFTQSTSSKICNWTRGFIAHDPFEVSSFMTEQQSV